MRSLRDSKSMRVLTHLSFPAVIFVIAVASGSGCGGSNSKSGSSGGAVDAPASLSGRTFDGTVTSGNGILANTGTFRISFAATTYAIVGDGVNTANSNGTYTYTAVGAVGTAITLDNLSGAGEFAFTYNTVNTGTYAASVVAGGSQAGTFIER